MKRFLKIILWTFVSIFIILIIFLGGFLYKVKNGFPVSYETEVPAIDFPQNKKAILLFSKTTGFRHDESIEAGKTAFMELSKKHDWFIYSTEEGGAFNQDQLSNFDVVIFNNSTGRVLTDEQQAALEQYVTNGGKLLGIHGAGDDSHHWDWYEQNLLGSKFSHHPIKPQLQEAEINLNPVSDSVITMGLPNAWTHSDEWYVFFENPRTKGFNIIYTLDGEKIIHNGNFLWVTDKDFGMGKDHPVAWYKLVGKGKTFYTSIGHSSNAWKQEPFLKMLENAIAW